MDVMLRLTARTEEPAGGCASPVPAMETGSTGGRAAWIFFHPAPNARERIIMEKAMYAGKTWDSQEHYQG